IMTFSWRRWLRLGCKSSARRGTRRVCPQLEGLEDRLVPAVYTVDALRDAGNADPNDPNKGDLRDLIDRSNANPGATPNTINCAIGNDGGVKTIFLHDALAITAPVLIDGYTQMGASVNNQPQNDNAVLKIVLDGRNDEISGLLIQAKDTTIRGLVLGNFKND